MGRHTPTPWSVREDEESGDEEWYGANGDIVKADDCDMIPADKAFALRAANAHDALVAALQTVRQRVSGNSVGVDVVKQIDAALALARKGE